MPVSFKETYRQGLIFRKALDRVIEFPGPLHQAFHMMQCVFNIYQRFLKWCGNKVLCWKKINHTDVSQSFHLSRQLLFMVLDEMERLAWDQFVDKHQCDIWTAIQNDECKCKIPFAIAEKFENFIKDQMKNAVNDYRKAMHNFIFLSNRFRFFWKCIRDGDRIGQESCMNEFLGVFYVLKKTKYFDIGLCQVERECSSLSHTSLQQLRINSTCRYQPQEMKFAPLHALDEVMENINQWAKMLPLGSNEDSWKMHSPNLMCARLCMNFERQEFINRRLGYENSSISSSSTSTFKNQVTPRQNVEKFRLYEFILGAFNSIPPVKSFQDSFAEDIVTNLTTKLQQETTSNDKSTDDLGETVQNLLEISSTHGVKELNDEDDTEENAIENDNEDGDLFNLDIGSANNQGNAMHPLATIDAVAMGNGTLNKMDLVELTRKINNRKKRFINHQEQIYNTVSSSGSNMKDRLEQISYLEHISKCPKYRDKHRLLIVK